MEINGFRKVRKVMIFLKEEETIQKCCHLASILLKLNTHKPIMILKAAKRIWMASVWLCRLYQLISGFPLMNQCWENMRKHSLNKMIWFILHSLLNGKIYRACTRI
ncbi:hypothetical protein CXU10_07150 [Akkermansia muciniphila]|nr:hypothetical protein CXU10_07150 [Akkermansia muciniphila]